MDWLVVGVYVEQGWCEYTTLWQVIVLLSPSAAFVVYFNIYILVDSRFLMFAILCSVVQFLYQKSMVYCVVRCRHVDKSGSRDLSFLEAIFNVLSKIQQLT